MTKILLIEDDEDIRLNIAEVLQLARYDVVSACNGKEGVEMVRTEHPDLIVCDVMMPVMDGFGVLHVLQMDEKTQNIPFIFLTSKNSISDLRHAMNLGADDYIIKPFEGSDLLDAIGNRLKKAEKQRKPLYRKLRLKRRYLPGTPWHPL
ncbi:MAG: response regulator [Taibaiella sp.]|nr:response regulator [Taibaiella sp.]